MSSRCDSLQKLLVERGPTSLRDDADGQQHLVDCSDCFSFMEALWEVDVQLRGLPELDAPEALVEETLAMVRMAVAAREEPEEESEAQLGWLRRAGSALLLPFPLMGRGFTRVAAGLAWLAAAIGRRLRLANRLRWLRPLYLAPAFGAASLVAFFVVVAVGLTPLSSDALYEESDQFAMLAMEPPAEPRSQEFQLPTPDKSRVEKKAEVKQKFARLFGNGGGSGSGGSTLGGGGGGTLAGELAPVAGDKQPNAPPPPPPESYGMKLGALGDSESGGARVSGFVAKSPGSGLAVGRLGGRAADSLSNVIGTTGRGAGAALAGNDDSRTIVRSGRHALDLETTGEELDELKEGERERSRRVASEAGLFRALNSGRGKDGKRRSISASTPVVMGALPKEVIQQVIRSRGHQVRYCYEAELQRTQGLSGKIAVKWIIAATGSVARVMVTESSLQNRNVENCIQAKIRTWRFPPPAGGGIVEVNYPFIFRSAGDGPAAVPAAPELAPARELLAARAVVDDIETREATGYWANTYVPGDPALRLLHAQLGQRDRAALFGSAVRGLHLDAGARQVAQPFDPPHNAALGVYLHADRRWAQGRTRALVQVGIKGTPRYSGSRPAMNLGVVLDMTGALYDDNEAAVRALITALSAARQTGDRFHLIVAGRPGGIIVPASEFRHGALEVALQQLLAGQSEGALLNLTTAMQTAVNTVIGGDDPTSALGSSAVILVTDRELGHEARQLQALAHDSAVNGVPVSVVGVGTEPNIAELDGITLAGQGNRRLLTFASDARPLVDRELSAVARVVARAVRLRIRLAPGVELIDVLGSHRLDEVRADEVRQAEVAIDRRLSRNLGLVSDRGEDEDGIQIVIPSYYAGDTHVVLLDVILPGPGPVADVRVRYKDLVNLRNGVARSNLSLERIPVAVGPLELNVLKNYVAHTVADELTSASERLADGDFAEAARTLASAQSLLEGLRIEVPGLASDRDLAVDLAMLDDYQRLLAQDDLRGERQAFLIDSLRYAGLLKLLPRPLDN